MPFGIGRIAVKTKAVSLRNAGGRCPIFGRPCAQCQDAHGRRGTCGALAVRSGDAPQRPPDLRAPLRAASCRSHVAGKDFLISKPITRVLGLLRWRPCAQCQDDHGRSGTCGAVQIADLANSTHARLSRKRSERLTATAASSRMVGAEMLRIACPGSGPARRTCTEGWAGRWRADGS